MLLFTTYFGTKALVYEDRRCKFMMIVIRLCNQKEAAVIVRRCANYAETWDDFQIHHTTIATESTITVFLLLLKEQYCNTILGNDNIT